MRQIRDIQPSPRISIVTHNLDRSSIFPRTIGGSHLECLYNDPAKGSILSTILKACFDETGTHHGAPLTCMGGYLFDEAGEQEFTKEWVRFLQPFARRGIRAFHANKCHGLKGEFNVLGEEEKEKLFTSLIALTKRTAKLGIVSAIRDEVFRTVIARNKFQVYTGSKYTVCALRSLTFIEQWADENKFQGKIVYQFESGNEHQGGLCDKLRSSKKNVLCPFLAKFS